jgi:hypothetical protein
MKRCEAKMPVRLSGLPQGTLVRWIPTGELGTIEGIRIDDGGGYKVELTVRWEDGRETVHHFGRSNQNPPIEEARWREGSER